MFDFVENYLFVKKKFVIYLFMGDTVYSCSLYIYVCVCVCVCVCVFWSDDRIVEKLTVTKRR